MCKCHPSTFNLELTTVSGCDYLLVKFVGGVIASKVDDSARSVLSGRIPLTKHSLFSPLLPDVRRVPNRTPCRWCHLQVHCSRRRHSPCRRPPALVLSRHATGPADWKIARPGVREVGFGCSNSPRYPVLCTALPRCQSVEFSDHTGAYPVTSDWRKVGVVISFQISSSSGFSWRASSRCPWTLLTTGSAALRSGCSPGGWLQHLPPVGR